MIIVTLVYLLFVVHIISMLSMKVLNYGTRLKLYMNHFYPLFSGIFVIHLINIIILYIYSINVYNITGCHQPHALHSWWLTHF